MSTLVSSQPSSNTLTIPSSSSTSDESSSNGLSSSPRRLSQHITDIVTSVNPTTRSRSSSSPRPPSPVEPATTGNKMTIEFDGGAQIIVRPNRIIRGK
jgi:hypothetical protein